MKCTKCGAELSEDTKFCSYCGAKVEDIHEGMDSQTIEKVDNKTLNQTSSIASEKPSQNGIKGKASEIWNKLSLLGKIHAISIALFVLLCLIGFAFGKTVAGVIAIVQIVLIIVAILIKKQILKVPKTWLNWIAFVLAFVLLIPYMNVMISSTSDAEKFQWEDIVLSDVLPEPKSHTGKIISNYDTGLYMYVYSTSASVYSNYVSSCKESGFLVEAEETDDSYSSYNEGGYGLSLFYDESDKTMTIDLNTPMELGDLDWPDSELAKLLPVPESAIGKIGKDDDTGLSVYVGNTPIDKYETYVVACIDRGFDIDVSQTEKSFVAKNSDFYKLSVSYQGNSVMYIVIEEPAFAVDIEVECVENLLFSKYDVDVYLDEVSEGIIEHGGTGTYSEVLKKGTHIIRFESAEDTELTGEVEIKVEEDEMYRFKISCSSTGIDVETLEGTLAEQETVESEEDAGATSPEGIDSPCITVTMSEDDFIGMLYTEAETKLREMGFTVFEYETLETEDINKPDDTIGAVEIKNWSFSNGDFTVGDTYESDAIVVLWYYICDEPEPNLTVENCPELAEMLVNKAELDERYTAFANKYEGRRIEFDGRIDYCAKHENYDTRFDYLVSAGDYDPDHQIGPTFKFEDVAYSDLNTDLDAVNVGLNVHIVAEVVSFDSHSGLFYLEPVSVTGR